MLCTYRPLRAAAVVTVLSLGLMACGNSDDAGDGDADAMAPPEVVRLGSSATPASGADMAATSEMSAEEPAEESAVDGAAMSADDMASSYMPMWTVITDIVVSDSLPALPTDAVGYVHRAGSTVAEATAVALAEAFGVDPTPVERPQEYMVEWAFGPEDGSAPSLTIDAYAQHYWWYSSGWSDRVEYAESAPACTETITADGEVTVDCPEWDPEPPVGVPTAADAEARAREIIRAAGFDDSALTFEVSADEWYASVYASEPLIAGLDGVTATNWNFGFGAEGRLEYAGGVLSAPDAVGPYPLVDVDTAVQRLQEMYVSSGWYGGDDVAIDLPAEAGAGSDAAVSVIVEEEVVMVEPSPEPLPAPAPEPDMPAPDMVAPDMAAPDMIEDERWIEPTEPTEITLTLVDVVADLWWTEDVDGNVWLLPAYRFIGDDDGWYTVPAVTDEFMVETPTYDEPVPAIEDRVVSSGSTDAATSGAAPSAGLAELLATADLTDVDDAVLAALEQILAGELAVDEQLFADTAAEFGMVMRVVERDGEPLMVTEDYRTDRINVVVADGVVVAIDGIG
ncbi:MAG: hypothetical protein ACO20G_01085 [Ilumatobacteraceae bacterium]